MNFSIQLLQIDLQVVRVGKRGLVKLRSRWRPVCSSRRCQTWRLCSVLLGSARLGGLVRWLGERGCLTVRRVAAASTRKHTFHVLING